MTRHVLNTGEPRNPACEERMAYLKGMTYTQMLSLEGGGRGE